MTAPPLVFAGPRDDGGPMSDCRTDLRRILERLGRGVQWEIWLTLPQGLVSGRCPRRRRKPNGDGRGCWRPLLERALLAARQCRRSAGAAGRRQQRQSRSRRGVELSRLLVHPESQVVSANIGQSRGQGHGRDHLELVIVLSRQHASPELVQAKCELGHNQHDIVGQIPFDAQAHGLEADLLRCQLNSELFSEAAYQTSLDSRNPLEEFGAPHQLDMQPARQPPG